VEIPASHEFVANDSIARTLSDDINIIILDSGYYHIDLYNTAAGVRINHPTAEVGVEDGMVDPMPGWFFTWAGDLAFFGDVSGDIYAVMRQEVRQLTFVIIVPSYLAGLVDSIEAAMGGVASSLNVDDGKPVGKAESVSLSFNRSNDSTFVASVRLMGIIGDTQSFSGRMTFTGDMPEPVHGDFELHERLAGFNDNKKEPMIFLARIIPLYDPGQKPPPPPLEAILMPWEDVSGDSIIFY
jgi:hypothetical protein